MITLLEPKVLQWIKENAGEEGIGWHRKIEFYDNSTDIKVEKISHHYA